MALLRCHMPLGKFPDSDASAHRQNAPVDGDGPALPRMVGAQIALQPSGIHAVTDGIQTGGETLHARADFQETAVSGFEYGL